MINYAFYIVMDKMLWLHVNLYYPLVIMAMQQLLIEKGMMITNRFGDGPNWRMRVIRSASDFIGFDSNILLQHSFKRGIYAVPLAKNFRSFLFGKSDKPIYYNLPMQALVKFWKERWLNMRKKNTNSIYRILSFNPEDFKIDKT